MTEIPKPPDAWWGATPWWGYFGFLLLVLFVSMVAKPWLTGYLNNRPSSIISREQAINAREARIIEREAAERVELLEDRRLGWDLARGWDERAHTLWHQANNAVNRSNAARTLMLRLTKGETTMDTLREMLVNWKPEPGPEPLPSATHLMTRRAPSDEKDSL